jgi:uncharacterized integral membrane protein
LRDEEVGMPAPNVPGPNASSGRSVQLSSRQIVAGGLAALALLFVFQNTASGKINVLFWSVTGPAWLWLIAIFAIGVVVGSLFPWFRRREKPKK